MHPNFVIGSDLLGTWLSELERGEPPVRFRLAEPFESIDVRPGRLVLFGGPPGVGKTAALLQIGIDLLRLSLSARLLVANVEMAPQLLVERVASRLSGVPLTAIADCELSADQLERVRAAVNALGPLAGRMAFLKAPFSLEHAAAAGTAFDANVLIFDYLQRFGVGNGQGDKREQLETAAAMLRRFCDAGAVVLAAVAVARHKNAGGSTYKGLNLASFRGSSELEYNADLAYLLVPTAEDGIEFKCEKNRYGPAVNIMTTFDADVQTFRPAPAGLHAFDAARPAGSGERRRRGM